MQDSSPAFKDRMLQGLVEAFVRRRKAIRRGGEFFIEALPEAEVECLEVRLVPGAANPVLILQAYEGHRLNVYLRSAWRQRRGLVLLRLEGLRVFNNPRRIVESFERSLDSAWCADPLEGSAPVFISRIATEWQKVVARAV